MKLNADISQISFHGRVRSRGYDQSFSTRYIIASEIVEQIRQSVHKKGSFEILDLGGYNGASRELLDSDHVTILDIFNDDELEDYIKVDSVGIPCGDDQFDIVISTDVLEHIKSIDREKFIDEAVRVAKLGVIILAPFDHGDGKVICEELYANSIYVGSTNKDYVWLKEHREYGLPTRPWLESYLEEKKLTYARASHSSLKLWSTLLTVGFFLASNISAVDKKLGNKLKVLNQEYFNNIARIDFTDDGYRSIYIISKHFSHIDIVTPQFNQEAVQHFTAKVNVTFGKVFSLMSEKIYNVKQLESQNQQLSDKLNHLNEIERQYKLIIQSKSYKLTRIIRKMHTLFIR